MVTALRNQADKTQQQLGVIIFTRSVATARPRISLWPRDCGLGVGSLRLLTQVLD